MSRRARRLFVYLLILAFPFKGAFAAGMIACGPAHDRAASASEWIAHVHHAVRGHQPDDVGHPHAHSDHDDSSAQDAEGALPDGEDDSAFSCDAYWTGGSFVSAAAPAVPTPPGGDLDFPDLIVRFSGHVPAAPERPPHSFVV